MATGQTSWFNSDLWKNHYARTQRLGSQPKVTPPPTPTMAVTTAAPPELDLSGVGNAGQKPVSGPAVVPPQPGPAPVQPAATQPAPVTVVPPTPPVSNPGPYQNLEGDVLKQLSAGINGTSALPGTEAAMRRNRETLAQYAGSMERQAGARATKAGAIGQGTAATLGDDTKSNVLSKLAENAQNEEQVVSGEKQSLIDKANQAVQANQNLQQNRDQFNANLAQRKVEFDKTFGREESAQYLNQLERMSQDNPVLAEKLSNYLMAGKTGPVGEFTPEEKAKLAEYVKKKEGSQSKLDEVMNKILEGLPAQVAAGQQSSVDATAATAATSRLNTLKPGEYLTDTEFAALQKSGGVKQATLETIPKGAGGVKEWLEQNPHGIINLDGKQYKVVRGGSRRTGAGTFSNQERHTDWVEVIDTKTGQTKYVMNPYNDGGHSGASSQGFSKDKPGIYDKLPKQVNNNVTPFGF